MLIVYSAGISGHVACDGDVSLYADGTLIGTSNTWTEPLNVELPFTIQVRTLNMMMMMMLMMTTTTTKTIIALTVLLSIKGDLYNYRRQTI